MKRIKVLLHIPYCFLKIPKIRRLMRHIVFILFACIFWSCAPRLVAVKTPKATPPSAIKETKQDRVRSGEDIYTRATGYFGTKSFNRAMDCYNQYLTRFPDGPYAENSLMKMGSIMVFRGRYDDARNAYRHLIGNYPDSNRVPDAQIGIIRTYYDEGEYETVLRELTALSGHPFPTDHAIKINRLKADTHAALGSNIDAAYYYTAAFKLAVGQGKEHLYHRIKSVIDIMPIKEMEALKNRLEDAFPKDYLLLRLGINYLDAQQYEDAHIAFTDFVNKFPTHENTDWANNQLENIRRLVRYDRYKLGCLLPLSGAYKKYGTRAIKGIELALNRFNAQGDTPPVSIMIRDTGSHPEKTKAAVQELIDSRVAAILGPMITAEKAAIEAQKNGIPIITVTQKDGINQIGEYVFRNFITPKMQVETIVSFAVENLGVKRFAVLYPREKYGKTFMNLFWDSVIDHGGNITALESYDPVQTDFADPINKMVGLYYAVPEDLQAREYPLRTNPVKSVKKHRYRSLDKYQRPMIDFDAIFIPDSPSKTGLIAPQLAYYNVKGAYLLGTNLWHSDTLIKMSRNFVQGAIFPQGFFRESDAPTTMNFIKKYQEVYGEMPGFIEAIFYDTTMILLKTISREDINHRSMIKNTLLKLDDFEGVTGLTAFDDDGNVRKNLYLLSIKGKKFIEIPRDQ